MGPTDNGLSPERALFGLARLTDDRAVESCGKWRLPSTFLSRSLHRLGRDSERGTSMTLEKAYVETLFANLAEGRQQEFFAHVADDVDWTVMGTHPLSGRYRSREEFFASTFARLNPRLKEGVVLVVRNVLVDGDQAAVELDALSTQNNGRPFANQYCWVCRFDGDQIVEVRAFLDSELVRETIEGNDGP